MSLTSEPGIFLSSLNKHPLVAAGKSRTADLDVNKRLINILPHYTILL